MLVIPCNSRGSLFQTAPPLAIDVHSGHGPVLAITGSHRHRGEDHGEVPWSLLVNDLPHENTVIELQALADTKELQVIEHGLYMAAIVSAQNSAHGAVLRTLQTQNTVVRQCSPYWGTTINMRFDLEN